MANFSIKMTKGLQKAIDKATPKVLKEAGRYVWLIARNLVLQRSNPNVNSAAGAPPYSHARKQNKGFKKTIVYDLDRNGTAAVIGPMLVRQGLSNIAKTHEFGGNRMVNDVDPKLADGISVGEEGPVTERYVSSKDSILHRDSHVDPRTGRKVVWIKIRTKKQAEHSTRLYFRMVKKYKKKVLAKYPARPYMKPALDLSMPKLKGFWKNAVKP